MSNNSIYKGPVIDLPAVLLILFITLKLCKVIAWSWWWVLSPLWITFLLAMIMIIISIFL